MVLVLGIVKAFLEILGIGIGLKKVVLLMSGVDMRLKSKNYSLNGWDVFMVQIFALHYWQQAYLAKSHTVNKI